MFILVLRADVQLCPLLMVSLLKMRVNSSPSLREDVLATLHGEFSAVPCSGSTLQSAPTDTWSQRRPARDGK